MSLPVIVGLVVCALLAAPAKSTEEEADYSTIDGTEVTEPEPEYYRMDKFMNTDDDIWVFNTTQSGPQDCKKDKKHNITNTNITFVRSHREGHTIVNETLVGYFTHYSGNETVYDGIDISGGTTDVYAEHLYYSSDDMKCGLVKVFAEKNTVWTELRVRGRANYDSLDEECRKEYKAYVDAIKPKKNSTSPYRDDCL
uniref:Lipocalin n=1 Tax=Rhipicephalus zambeziensis TaxID=60191 RepID=A0A224YBX2_9ACAR